MLQYLLSLLSSLIKNSEQNGITIDALAIIFGPCLLCSRPDEQELEVELGVSIIREMLQHYDHLFVHLKNMTWKANDGLSQLAIAYLEQIVETAVDPNYVGTLLIEMLNTFHLFVAHSRLTTEDNYLDALFLTYDYYTSSVELLNSFISLYDRYGGSEEYMVEIRRRFLHPFRE